MSTDNKTLPEYWAEARAIFKHRSEQSEPEFPTGLNFLDEATDGLGRGEVWIIAGKTGSGKTTLALQLAKTFADNPKHSIAIMSLEMKGWELITRMFCLIHGFSYIEIKKGIFPAGYHEKNKEFQDYINMIDLQIYECGYSFNEIEKVISSDYYHKKPDVIFIDFLQLVEWRSFKEERLALSEYIRKLKELANTLNIGVVAISQLRRLPSGVNYERPPDVIDLKGSGALEQAADKILFVYGVQDGDDVKHFVNLAKNRQGETTTHEVVFQGWRYRFVEPDEAMRQANYESTVNWSG